MTQADPKTAISEELEKDSPDWQLIERLSRSIVDDDPRTVRFTVDAGHIQRLGVELVGKQGTAVSELIKNAYDADATQVELNFSGQGRKGGMLVISDNGVGMTDQVIRSSWMRISTTDKADNPVSPLYGRPRAGKKGIGRFAVQRLGKRLELETKPRGSEWGYRVSFEWDESFAAGRDLSDVFNAIDKFEKDPEDQGTTLKIIGLRDAWSESAIKKIWRSVMLLQPPFPLAKPSTKQSSKRRSDPGFSVTIDNVSQANHAKSFSIEDTFLSLAVVEIAASIDDEGVAKAHLKSKKLDIDETFALEDRFKLVGPTTFSTRYFIYATQYLGGMSQADAARMGREYGGIRIYRNGFRVLPYGEANDDWLRFDADSARRVLLVPAGNQNFFGQVDLDGDRNPLLEETSSREGLIENGAFFELRDFVRQIIDWATKRVAAARSRKQTAGQRNFVPQPKKPSQIIDALAKKSQVGGTSKGAEAKDSASDENSFEAARDEARRYEEAVELREAASLEYEQMLRLLASLGLSISVFGHEVKGSQDSMRAQLTLLEKRLTKIESPQAKDILQKSHDNIRKAAERIFDIGGYIAGLMSSTESRKLSTLSVVGAVDRFEEHFSEYLSNQSVELMKNIQPQNLRTTKMHASEFDSVLLNFLTNSMKSMKRAKVSPRRVRIDARLEGKYAVLGFEDNGTGIADDDRDRAFDAFFTTTINSDEDGVAGPGTGLGLKIVSDIAETYGGEVSFVAPSDGYKCRIEFKLLADEGIV
ncbi:sensor histidine kinase [Novosphingopyxis baekryungensis]|uniref:sensor histidine kinase n=1 Tax=Novosphingopyxis baekryungensis TaxID=279369 RepID=UPI0003B72FF3|nr:sensor histidine kinase [Novosphingopyxis baekryungensis]